MKRLTLLGLAACLLACGCDDSKNPLSDPQAAKPDEKLLGTWRHQEKEDVSIYHIGLAGEKYPKGMLRVVEVSYHKHVLQAPDEYLAFTTVIGANRYLNVITNHDAIETLDGKGWKAERAGNYTLLKYRVDGEKLITSLTNGTAVIQAVKDGKIKGKEKNHLVTLTDSTENLARFVVAEDGTLWEKSLSFERVEIAGKH